MPNFHLKLFITFLFILQLNILLSRDISYQEAQKVAENFLRGEYAKVGSNIYKVSLYDLISDANRPVLYIFSVYPEGFIIISGDDAVKPVLAYSKEYSYENEFSLPPAYISWIDWCKKQIIDAKEQKIEPYYETYKEWQNLLTGNINKNNKSVLPLLTSKWDQGVFYNELCPPDQLGPGGKVWAGCVATAMAQVMYYYKYPTQGNGYHSYIHPVYGYLSANFGSTTYEWVPMLNSINSSNLPIATLIYHCGVAVEMNYSPSGSGALLDVAAFALKNYFKYSNNIKYYERDNYPYVWNDLLTSNLDLGRPIIYAGFDPNNYNGHAFIIDGYDNTNYYHINWGWGGAYNGYFYIDNLNPGSSDYTAGQQAIVNIYPQSNYPLYCSGTKTYTYSAGVFDDGSGPIKDYLNNTDCLWLIKPSDAVDNIKLKFLQFNTETNVDKVIVYDGSDIYAPVLGTFSGNSLPNIVTSTGNEMLVRFITNGNNTTAGWLAEYYSTKSLYCSGTIVLTEPSDVFSDGSGNAQYNNNSNCKWIIAPPDVSSITISFIDFEVEPVNDFVKIIDPTKSPAVTLATYSGFSVPQPFTFYGQELLVLFKTGPSITYQGWTAQYTTTPLSVNNLLNIEDNNLIFYPNPTNDIVNITFISNNAKPLLVNVYDEIGNKLLTKKFQTAKGINNYTLSLKSLPSGIYILNLLNEEVTYSKKILIYK